MIDFKAIGAEYVKKLLLTKRPHLSRYLIGTQKEQALAHHIRETKLDGLYHQLACANEMSDSNPNRGLIIEACALVLSKRDAQYWIRGAKDTARELIKRQRGAL